MSDRIGIRRSRGGLVRTAPHPLRTFKPTPDMTVKGQTVYGDPLDIATVPVSRLRDVSEILSEGDQDRIIRAIDQMICRA